MRHVRSRNGQRVIGLASRDADGFAQMAEQDGSAGHGFAPQQINDLGFDRRADGEAGGPEIVGRQRQAEQSIHDDPLVQQMIQQFGASIRADSIEPLTP